MINAYYSKDCNSKEQFSKLKIFKTDNFAKYLNQFNVIYLDIKSLVDRATNEHDVVEVIKLTITKELQDTFTTQNLQILRRYASHEKWLAVA